MIRQIRQGPARGASRAISIYGVMLIVSCVAMAIAIFFPTFEYFTLYRGPVRPVKSVGGTPTAERAPARQPEAPEAPEAEEAPEPEAEAGEPPAEE